MQVYQLIQQNKNIKGAYVSFFGRYMYASNVKKKTQIVLPIKLSRKIWNKKFEAKNIFTWKAEFEDVSKSIIPPVTSLTSQFPPLFWTSNAPAAFPDTME